MNKNINIKKIVLILTGITLVSFSIVVIFSPLADWLEDHNSYNTEKNTRDISKEQILDIKNTKNIIINAVSEDVTIFPINESEAKVNFFTNINNDFAPELIIDQRETDLRINIRHKRKLYFTFFDFREKSYLELYLPKDYSKDISIGTVSGDILLDDFNFGNVNYKSVSGNIKANNIFSNDTKIDTTSGEVEIYGICQNLDFRSVSGNFSSSGLFTKESKLKTTSGDIYIEKFSGDFVGNTVSGNIKINYSEFDNDITVKTTSGDAKFVLPANAEFMLNFRSTSGDYNSDFPVTIKNSNKKHHIDGFVKSDKNKIDVTTVSGNLEIRN